MTELVYLDLMIYVGLCFFFSYSNFFKELEFLRELATLISMHHVLFTFDLDLGKVETSESEEEGTRHFMVNVIEPQFNLHSEEANVSNYCRVRMHS